MYVEKCDNLVLLRQLRKDRRKAVEGFVDTVARLLENGDWVKSYIGNQIVENKSFFDSTDDGGESLRSPVKEFNIENADDKPMKELITTERFLYDDDLRKNPYIFESDEFVRQKFLEKRYKEYSAVNIRNDEFITQRDLKIANSKKKVEEDDLKLDSEQGKSPAKGYHK